MRRVRAALNPSLDIEGVLLTMFDERTNLGQQVANEVRQFFKEKVFRTVDSAQRAPGRSSQPRDAGHPVRREIARRRRRTCALWREKLARERSADHRRVTR